MANWDAFLSWMRERASGGENMFRPMFGYAIETWGLDGTLLARRWIVRHRHLRRCGEACERVRIEPHYAFTKAGKKELSVMMVEYVLRSSK